MNELEALNLRSGEVVVCKTRSGLPRLTAVYMVHPVDMTPERAMQVFGYDPVSAVMMSYDGPIIETMDSNSEHTMWPSFLVERPDVLMAFECQYCDRAIEFTVPYDNYRMWLQGVFPIDMCFPKLLQTERDCIRLKACGYCQRRIIQDEMRRLRKEDNRQSRRILP
jgi:hypothetical protein